MSIHLSRPSTPSESVKGLGPFRTPRARPGRLWSPAAVDSAKGFEDRPQSRGFARTHRRTSSATDQPFTTPKSRRGVHIDRAQTDSSYSRAPSPPVAGSHNSRHGYTLRSSFQSLGRSGSFSLLRTPKGRSSAAEAPELAPYNDYQYEDGSRFDILSADPFRSDPFRPESPIPILDIEEAPPVPPKNRPLLIRPPSRLIIPDETIVEVQSPTSEGSRTPTSATVAAMKSAFNRITTTGKSRIRLLSFIKETKSPILGESPRASPPQLQLPTFKTDEPLFDATSFQLPEIPIPRKKNMRVEGPTIGHAAPPPRVPTPKAAAPVLGTLPGASALQLDLNGDFEGYMLPSPAESVHQPSPQVREAPNWIKEFRAELEQLAGEALNLTTFPDKLVLELPEEPGRSHRRTLVFTDADIIEESTPELTSDSVSDLGRPARPAKPSRPIPPVPQESYIREPSGVSGFTDASWFPHLNREARASYASLQTISTFDPSRPIPSIPDQDSYISSDDEHTIGAEATEPQPYVFQPAVSKQEAIEEAIRKIQRKAEASKLRVTQEEEDSDSSSDSSDPPPVIEKGPILLRHASNPFATSFESVRDSKSKAEPPKQRKVSLLRKRVLSRSSQPPPPRAESSTAAAHSRSRSDSLVPFGDTKNRNIVIAGRLPLTTRIPSERVLPSIPSFESVKPGRQYQAQEDYFIPPPVYLASSTPTFEVVPSPTRKEVPAVYYPVDPTPLAYPKVTNQSSDYL